MFSIILIAALVGCVIGSMLVLRDMPPDPTCTDPGCTCDGSHEEDQA